MNIALIGYGKMGKAIEAIAVSRGHNIVLTIDSHNHPDLIPEKLTNADVAIEFTGPESAFKNVVTCLDAKVPVVCGSTGWLTRFEEAKIVAENNRAAFIYASNFSIGVNIFFEINKKLASLMNERTGYNVSLEEIHHTQKKDAPSGTAISLAEQIMMAIPGKTRWVNETTSVQHELEIISKREDPAPGTHRVKYQSDVDSIEIVHTAHNRNGFALGAVLAAEFINGKSGIFTMKEVLGINET
jgi:4-hydroxy-tetrahydrodipicolinate reductase